MASEFTGSFDDDVLRDHVGHLEMGSFGNVDCPACQNLQAAHALHTRQVEGSFSEGNRGEPRDEEGHLAEGSFADTDCPICQAEAARS
jgi:rubrerythrin